MSSYWWMVPIMDELVSDDLWISEESPGHTGRTQRESHGRLWNIIRNINLISCDQTVVGIDGGGN